MFKLFKSNALFLPICDKFRNLNTKFRIFSYICTRKLSVNIKNQ